ncbi:nicotinate-nucleotide--dimethylbenzimidazole phosphoribosyltransferase [Gayadomonas joobiniege]|uniref:nicotinate-nucleotide--dimethylbenzimidazole phosphoribosyltransferase n=1 Tax=Gayadomonas joobiniege TaxID=1234606 RepID=UPI00035F3835|nr:nicotinate-nucleotide--dimethylbenzimidazole phosphoribosyltransferase [Gayadomonas joobiniege]
MNDFNIISPELALSEAQKLAIQATIDGKAKPLGSLGRLEALAYQLACIQTAHQKTADKLVFERAAVLVFAGDHGIAEHGISIVPSEITAKMVQNFVAGGAAINALCQVQKIPLTIINAGIKHSLHASYINQVENLSAGSGTQDFSEHAAMSLQTAFWSIQQGAEITRLKIANGKDIFVFGEMGIGNTASASALTSVLCDSPLEKLVGRGTGISDAQLAVKLALVKKGVERAKKQVNNDDPVAWLAQLGGFEIAQMCGGMMAAAQAGKVVLVDGFICSVAALLACRIEPACLQYMVFSHQSEEPGQQAIFKSLNVRPLFDLNLRLGEGTGAVLAVPFIQSAAAFYNKMANLVDL